MMKNCSCCIIQTSQATLTFSIWRCDQFDLDLLTADECKSEFRFYKKDVYLLTEVLQVPDQIRCYNRVVVDGIEALCIFLKGFTYPCGYFDMLSRFARPVLQLCMKSKQVMDFIYQTHHHHLKNFNRPCLSQASLQNSTEVIHVTGAPLRICWGFFDGTIIQRVLYNGHKRVHTIKFQSIAAPNGLIANLFGPVEGTEVACYQNRDYLHICNVARFLLTPLIYTFKDHQGCALRKIEGCPVLWTCTI